MYENFPSKLASHSWAFFVRKNFYLFPFIECFLLFFTFRFVRGTCLNYKTLDFIYVYKLGTPPPPLALQLSFQQSAFMCLSYGAHACHLKWKNGKCPRECNASMSIDRF